jgi:hypothetical protein
MNAQKSQAGGAQAAPVLLRVATVNTAQDLCLSKCMYMEGASCGEQKEMGI